MQMLLEGAKVEVPIYIPLKMNMKMMIEK